MSFKNTKASNVATKATKAAMVEITSAKKMDPILACVAIALMCDLIALPTNGAFSRRSDQVGRTGMAIDHPAFA